MIAVLEQQTAVLKAILDALQKPQPVVIQPSSPSVDVSTVSIGQQETVYTREIIIEKGKTYTRETHQLLFAVVDWLEVNTNARNLAVRPLAAAFEGDTGTPVSKSWAAVAKNYWIANSALERATLE